MKALLLSVRPEHALNILQGNKTLELRKTVPHDFRGWVYLYVTMAAPYLYMDYSTNEDGFTYVSGYNLTNDENECFTVNGKVVAKFWFDEHIAYRYYSDDNTYFAKRPEDFGYSAEEVLKRLCLTREEFKAYGNGRDLYAWHIKKLDIFDKPMQLGEFTTIQIPDDAIIEKSSEGMSYFYRKERPSWKMYFSYLTKAPQSYMYVCVKEVKRNERD